MKKKIFACALIVVILACMILNVFAETFVYSMVYTREYQQNVRDEGVNTLQDYYDIYYSALTDYEISVMYFEFLWFDLGVEMPSQVNYFPSANNWLLPYGFQEGVSGGRGGDALVRFYVTSPNWDFEIRTTNNNYVLFDSTQSQATATNFYTYYYTFTVSLQALIDSQYGWYIYSESYCPFYQPVFQPDNPGPFDITINYVDDNTIVSSKIVQRTGTTEPFYLTIPPINGYIIDDETLRTFGYPFNSLTQNATINVPVISYTEYADKLFDLGKDLGYQNGKNEGYSEGYVKGEEIGLANGEDIGYWKGVNDANEGKVIVNPLNFVLEPVAAFLNMQLMPGLSLGIMFLAVFVFAIVLIFLKIFAGG